MKIKLTGSIARRGSALAPVSAPAPTTLVATMLVCGLVCVLVASPLAGQIPETSTNLQVLPKDMDQRALVDLMRGFAGGLGVRCKHCHVGENTDSLEGFDFASDKKETKKVARAMMRMTQEINKTFLPKTGREHLVEVSCRTCHHGTPKPQELRAILAETLEKDGLDAVGTRYQDLHDEYYGKGVYRFDEFTLTGLAERVAAKQDVETAIALLDLNLTLHPKSAYSHLMKGRIYAMSGARDDARDAFEHAIELDPENAWAKQQLERLQAADTETP